MCIMENLLFMRTIVKNECNIADTLKVRDKFWLFPKSLNKLVESKCFLLVNVYHSYKDLLKIHQFTNSIIYELWSDI